MAMLFSVEVHVAYLILVPLGQLLNLGITVSAAVYSCAGSIAMGIFLGTPNVHGTGRGQHGNVNQWELAEWERVVRVY
ncbi:hypothetical protein Tco_1252817 [Tanacetum coccineum]